MAVGEVVNYNNGDGVVRALVARELDDTRVYLWAPERGSGHLTLVKGDADTGVPRRAPADYGAEGGGVTWHTLAEQTEDPDN